MKILLLFLTVVLAPFCVAQERPLQMIALAFDICSEVSRWEDLLKFSDSMYAADKKIHFTFFVSGINFITEANKKSYQGPHHKAGEADIDFASDDEEILERLNPMHELYQEGHEFASHGIGHFSGKRTLSMDYNFYVAQSGANEMPDQQEEFKQEMLDTYLEYFNENYHGNRAPIHIGHHFFPYQGAVYHEALQEFAKMVCGRPEVRCVSYRELADYLDMLDDATLQDYQKGNFEHLN